MQNRRTRQPVMMVAFTVVICLNVLCVSTDPAMNWSSRSLAGFRNLFRHNNGGHLLPPIIPPSSKQYRRTHQHHSSNSSLIPSKQISNIRSVNKENILYNKARNLHSRKQPSTQHISKRRLSWNSPSKTLYPSSRSYAGGQQYSSYSRYIIKCNKQNLSDLSFL